MEKITHAEIYTIAIDALEAEASEMGRYLEDNPKAAALEAELDAKHGGTPIREKIRLIKELFRIETGRDYDEHWA
jgi:hypothetical protein